MSIIDAYKKRVKGMVRNHSSKTLWVVESEAISLGKQGIIDNAVVVHPKKGEPYLRSRPDRKKENNFSQMVS
jgi:hypothetical protein